MSLDGGTNPSRGELIEWINKFLRTNYTSLSEFCDGIAPCRVFSRLYPQALRTSRIIDPAIRALERLANWRELQAATLLAPGVNPDLDVARLSQGCASDLLDVLQWLRRLFDSHRVGVEWSRENLPWLSAKDGLSSFPFNPSRPFQSSDKLCSNGRTP